MTTQPPNPPEDLIGGGNQISKKAVKEEAAKLEKQRRRDAKLAEDGATSAARDMPIRVEDCARSEVEIEEALKDTRLNDKEEVSVSEPVWMNLPDPLWSIICQHLHLFDRRRFRAVCPFFKTVDAETEPHISLPLFRIQSQFENIFRNFLISEGFVGIHTPKLIGGSSEGGSAVFRLDYKGQPACLPQSPQLYNQMAICHGFGRVFEVGAIYRIDDSFTHRHLCNFTGLDVEMEIKEHYNEVMDFVGRLFVAIFDSLNETCKKELQAINRQYPFQPLKYLRETLRLTFEEGVQMLQEAGVNVDPYGDLNIKAERKLGQLVLEKYGTEFYILHRYPLAVRPFYTMPCYDDPSYSNSFDVFIRGEEIISGGQRIHEPELLTQRAKAMGIDVNMISTYIDSFRYGAPPHGGFGAVLERVVMLFCALDDIRKTSLFPRVPRRIFP